MKITFKNDGSIILLLDLKSGNQVEYKYLCVSAMLQHLKAMGLQPTIENVVTDD